MSKIKGLADVGDAISLSGLVSVLNGNVGIGTTPSTLLHIAANNPEVKLEVQANGGTGIVSFFDETDTIQYSFGYRDVDTTFYIANGLFSTAANRVFSVDSAGDVEVLNDLNVADGILTLPSQPSFLAFNTAVDPDVTGDGTVYTVICNSEVYDQGADYNNATGVFTAPVTGRYEWTVSLAIQTAIGAAHNRAFLAFVTSNRSYYPFEVDPFVCQSSSGNLFLTASGFADMDAGDTAHFTIAVSGSTKTVDVYGNAAALGTYFSMSLKD